MILNGAQDYYENDKERLKEQARDKYRNYLKKIKRKRENTEKIDIIIWAKIKRIPKKNIKKQKSLTNKIVF